MRHQGDFHFREVLDKCMLGSFQSDFVISYQELVQSSLMELQGTCCVCNHRIGQNHLIGTTFPFYDFHMLSLDYNDGTSSQEKCPVFILGVK